MTRNYDRWRGVVWGLRRPSSREFDYVAVTSAGEIFIRVVGRTTSRNDYRIVHLLRLDRRTARLLARRIDQALVATGRRR